MNEESDEIPVDEIEDTLKETNPENTISSMQESTIELDLTKNLEQEKENSLILEDKLARTLADFQNLEKKMQSDIQNSVTVKLAAIFTDLLSIRDDFERARNSLAENKNDIAGLNSILKNMDSVLSKYGVESMENMGDIFDPNMHEAISVTEDALLEENTITKIFRKGYILHDKVIQTSLVEISKKPVVD